MGTKRSKGIDDVSVWLIVPGIGLQIDCCTECASAIGRCSHAALNLDALRRCCDVGDINPIHALGFTIIVRYAIEGDVDARRIATAYPDARVPYSRASIRCCYY